MICSKCGASTTETDARCRSCGATQPGSVPYLSVLLAGTVLLDGAYVIEEPLGRGASAITYRATDTREPGPAAIKEFFPTGCERRGAAVQPGYGWDEPTFIDSRQRFLQEGQRLAGLQHPNIVRVLDAFEENNTAYLAMEFVQGETFRHLVRQSGPISEKESLDCIRQVASALEAVHALGILHLDIKPANIMLTNEGRVVVVSFGAAKQYAASAVHTDSVSLTPGYAPLEQYSFEAPRGACTDVYSLAGTLYYLLTGTPPPPATERVQGVSLPDIRTLCPDVSERTASALAHGMALKAADRPQSVSAFVSELGIKPAPGAMDATSGIPPSGSGADPQASSPDSLSLPGALPGAGAGAGLLSTAGSHPAAGVSMAAASPAAADNDRTTVSRGPARKVAVQVRRPGNRRPLLAAWLLLAAAVAIAAAFLLARGNQQSAVNYGTVRHGPAAIVAQRPGTAAALAVIAAPSTAAAGGAAPGRPSAMAHRKHRRPRGIARTRRITAPQAVGAPLAPAPSAAPPSVQMAEVPDQASQEKPAAGQAPQRQALSPAARSSIPAVAAARSVPIARVGYQALGLGFRIDRPAGWMPQASWEGGTARTWFRSPDGRATIMVEEAPRQTRDYPEQTWRWQDAKFRQEYGPDYTFLGVQRGMLEGYRAVAWSFLLRFDQTTYRKVDVLLYRGGRGYAILFSAPADEFGSFQTLFRHIANSFRFTTV